MHIWYPWMLQSAIFVTLATRGEGINSCVDPDSSGYQCRSPSTVLKNCGLTDADIGDVIACFDAAGRETLETVSLSQNSFTELPAGLFGDMTNAELLYLYGNDLGFLLPDVFEGLTSLKKVYLYENELVELPVGLFQDQESLEKIYLHKNKLGALDADIFQGLTTLEELYLYDNELDALDAAIFQGLTSLDILNVAENNLEELPTGLLQGLPLLRNLYLRYNNFATIPADAFGGLTTLETLYLRGNELDALPDDVFADLESLLYLYLDDNNFNVLPVDTFKGLTSLLKLDIGENTLTTLPDGIFEDLTSLENLILNLETSADRTNDIQCLPTLSSDPTIEYDTPTGTCECTLDGVDDVGAIEILCGTDMSCLPGTTGYTCDTSAGGIGDPHMVGFSGQNFDFTGKDGSWYSLLKDGQANINMRVTAPLRELNAITYITGISILAADHDDKVHAISIYVEHAHTMDSACPVDVSPCLANGALTILLDGEEVVSPSEVTLGPGVSFGAVNLPGQCRPFGFEKYWERKIREAEASAHTDRRLKETVKVTMAEWILSDRLATNRPECEVYLKATDELFAHQSEHVSFQLVTPTFTMRLNYGKLHQLAERDPTDHFDLPDHVTHQMNLGLSHVVLGQFPEGILGETVTVRTDMYGVPILTGIAAIAGNEENYQVEGAFGTNFERSCH